MDEYSVLPINENSIQESSISRFFKIKDRNSNLRQEIIAGFIVYFTITYIIFVNPLILSHAQMDIEKVTNSTIISISIWWNWRKRPFCGLSALKEGPT